MSSRPLVLLAWCALFAGCPLPSLSELEKQARSHCDDAHPCADGWHCAVDGLCAANGDTGGACSDGDTQACGMNVGECRPGTQTCSGGKFGACMGAVGPNAEVCDGKDNDCNNQIDDNATDAPLCPLQAGVCLGRHAACGGTCTAATYGPDYEATETRCDGKDNDCNGGTDVGLTSLCVKQLGECAGASTACSGGTFPACGSSTYTSHRSTYEDYETKCDGLDNDCDGQVDSWAFVKLSGSGRARRPAAVAIGSDVLVLWEEQESGNFKVKARRVGLDSSMTSAVSPSTTAAATMANGLPALALDGTVVVGAWVETVSSGTRRVSIATLDRVTGQSTAGGGALPVVSGSINPTDVAVAVDATGDIIVTSVVDGAVLSLYAYPAGTLAQGPTAIYQKNAVQTGVAHARLAPAGGRNFWLTYETSGGVTRCLVDGSGTVSCGPAVGGSARSPVVVPDGIGAPFEATSLYLADRDAGVQKVVSATCFDGGLCTTGATVTAVPPRSSMQALQAAATARGVAPTLLSWDEAGLEFHYVLVSRSDGGVQPASPSPGQRPQPVFTGADRGALVFDTEGVSSSLVTPDAVYLARYCF